MNEFRFVVFLLKKVSNFGKKKKNGLFVELQISHADAELVPFTCESPELITLKNKSLRSLSFYSAKKFLFD